MPVSTSVDLECCRLKIPDADGRFCEVAIGFKLLAIVNITRKGGSKALPCNLPHWRAALRRLDYIKGIRNLVLCLGKVQ